MHTVQFVHTGDECDIVTEVRAEDGQTIQNVADENEIHTRRGCNNGRCGLCRVHVIEGNEHVENSRSKKLFHNPERVLGCVAKIHGDITVVIKTPKPIGSATLPSSEQ